MKKQINPTIKAHLIRGAFYLLLLLAVCAIPFALARPAFRGVRAQSRSLNLPALQGATGFTNVNRGAPPAAVKGAWKLPFLFSNQPSGTCPSTITHSSSQAIVEGNSVACNDNTTGFTTENHYWRAFNMNTFTGGQEYDVTSVSFGIELAESGSGTGQPITVNLYVESGAPFPNGTRTLLGTSGSVNVPDQTDSIFSVPLTATVPAGALELIMEVLSPDGRPAGNRFFIGSNTDPETGPSYLSAADCGVTDPTPVGTIGFPNMHIVMNVNGSCPSGGTPTPTATGSPSPTPTATCVPTYTTATGTGAITGAGTDIGNHCDDCFTQINLPFPVNVYGAPTSVAFPASNGDLHFANTTKMFAYAQCVPVDPTPPDGPFLNTLFPYYDDLRTDETGICPDCGIFTQTLGSAPNRQFVIRWKTTFFTPPAGGNNAEFEVILTEGSDTLSVIYGDTSGDNGETAASGIQQDLTVFTSFSCFETTLTPGVRVDYIPTGCGSPSPTRRQPTATATATAHCNGDAYCYRGTAFNSDTASAANAGASPVARAEVKVISD